MEWKRTEINNAAVAFIQASKVFPNGCGDGVARGGARFELTMRAAVE
jgi:hypothetical protein